MAGAPKKMISDLPEGWKEAMIACGMKGKTQRYLQKRVLHIDQKTFDRMRKDEPEFEQAVQEFRAEAAIYWEELAEAYARGDEGVINQFSNFNALKYNIKNRPYVGWHDKEVVESETTIKADDSATKLFAQILEQTKN